MTAPTFKTCQALRNKTTGAISLHATIDAREIIAGDPDYEVTPDDVAVDIVNGTKRYTAMPIREVEELHRSGWSLAS